MLSNIFKDISFSFQPIVNLATGEVDRYEALSRFDYFSPSDVFHNIQYVEDSGFACEFDRRVLWSASDLLKNPDFLNGRQVNINITGQSLSTPAFYFWIQPFIKKLKNIELLGLEITETLPITNLEVCQAIINYLDSAGVKVYLDDIPSGYMDLEVMKALKSYHGLKIDGRIVNQWGVDRAAVKVTKEIIRISKERELTITAEFIDSPEKILFAQKHGIHYAQGFMLGQPLPIPENPEIIKQRFNQARETGLQRPI